MGNNKIYTIRCPLRPGEGLFTYDELSKVARSSLVVASRHDDGDGNVAMMCLIDTCSQSADEIVALVRARYPARWCLITRFDADWSDFRVMSWEDDQEDPDIFLADNWRKVVP